MPLFLLWEFKGVSKDEEQLAMVYQIEIREKVIINHFSGNHTEAEGKQIEVELNAILDAAPGKLDYIVDLEQMRSFQSRMLLHHKYVSYLKHPNMGEVVIYGNNSTFIQVINGVLSRVIPYKYTYVDNLEAALKYLASKKE